MKWLLVGIILCVLDTSAFSQQKVAEDIRLSLTSKPKLILGFNNRNSFFSGEPVKLRGLQAGLDYNKIFRLTLGFNWMPNTPMDVRYRNVNGGVDTISRDHQMRFISFTAEYVFHLSDKWRFSAPVSLGWGRYTRTTNHTVNATTNVERNAILPLEFGATGTYFVTDWFGPKVGLGNRLSFGKNFGSTSGPYYSFGFVLFIQPLLEKTPLWDALNKRKSEK